MPSRFTIPSGAGNLYDTLTTPEHLAVADCVSAPGYAVPPECVTVYGVRLRRGAMCSTLPGVIVVSTSWFGLFPANAEEPSPAGLNSLARRRALVSVQRGWRYYEEPPTAGDAWPAVDELVIEVIPDPAGACEEPFAFPD